MKRTASARAVLLATAALLLLPSPGSAQYFGRNKVRYHDFDFRVLKTEHFDIYYYPEEKEAVELSARMAERWYARLSEVLDHDLSSRQPLILYASHAHFEQTNSIPGELGEGTGGVTESLKRRVVMPLAGPLAETDHVLGHEIVHAFQYDIAGQGRGAAGLGALRLPLWFIEGMAEYLSVGSVDPHTSMWLRDAARRDKLPTIRDLNNPRYFPYRYGQALWAYLAGRYGDEVVGRALKSALRGDAEVALERVTDTKSKQISEQWHAAIKEAYGEELTSKPRAAEQAKPLVTDKNAGELNIGPALSPDGQRLVFLSEKSQFAVEMFLADAVTGKVRDRVVKTAADPHFDSLQFIGSSGSFGPDGKRFSFAAVKNGRPALVVRDVEGGDEREVVIKTLHEVHDPTWSPDGKRVAFSGNQGGLLDLYIYDLETGALKRLTQDAYADLQPAWSPDGTGIVFVTDRFTTDLAKLDFGEYRLGLIDVESGQVRPLTTFEGAKSIDPQWSPDGRQLYFLSDRGGITNVYRLDMAGGGALSQVTDLFTGVSGITALSPALTVARDRLVMSVYEDDKHALYALEGAERLAGRELRETRGPSVAVLPPRDRNAGEVQELIEDPLVGLPRSESFATRDYSSKLSLDELSQASAGLGSDPFGTYVSGGVAFGFSDMLGDHNVGVVVQANGGFKDVGGLVGYENRKSRLNWGATLHQIPYRNGSFLQAITTINGERVLLEEATIFRETHRGATVYASYPFSRSHRFEVGAGYRNIGFDVEVQRLAASLNTGQIVIDEREDLPSPSSLNLGEASAALVYDSSVFGATGPILGRRYRLEVSPSIGSLRYTGVLADIRQYLMPLRPYTFAFRLLHYGRYGDGGEDPRLVPLFLGYPYLVRGYDFDSFSAAECGVSASGNCPVFDQLVGSRMALLNAELRFPPFSALGGRRLYGPVPVDLLAFFDTGVAWTSQDEADFLGGERKRVSSVGFGARVNVLGFLVGEVDYVKPLDRPGRGWHWQFNFTAGY
jgi:Tol biopolymer transport system component